MEVSDSLSQYWNPTNSFISFIELFQKLFNILYEENINCRLVKSIKEEDKILNWNRINVQVCFNYLQQEFYLVSPTMKTLAAGKSQKTILKLLRILINTSQSNFGDLALDDGCIRDIADVITADTPVDVTAAGRRSSPSPGRQAAATFQGEEIKEQEDEVRADGKRLAYV